jgi:hypothetical protein
MPGACNTAAWPTAWLNTLIGAATAAIKAYCKQELELANWVEYFDGNGRNDLPLYQFPLWFGRTAVTAGSNGAVLPQATINVASTAGFPPGTFADPTAVPPTLGLQTGTSSWTSVTYTGTTSTSFTGCSGGAGTLATGYAATNPVAWLDMQGYGGQAPNSFNQPATGNGTQLLLGQQFMALPGQGGRQSKAGILRRIGVGGGAFGLGNWWSPYQYQAYVGKLAATREPYWPIGSGNVKVAYSSGFHNSSSNPVPFDLANAAAMLVAQMVRINPSGTNLSSESLGAYSYSVLDNPDNPSMGDIRRTLAVYRDSSFAVF